MREIEVKARLRDSEKFLAAARKLGIKFGEETYQADKTYTDSTPHSSPAWNIFRLREQGSKTLFTMKFNASDRSYDKHEYETEVAEGAEVEGMLKRLGYEPDVRINKKRRKAKYNGLELCMDEVERLGAFAEVEKLAQNDADVDAVQAELWGLLESLGVHKKDRVHEGYDDMIRELDGKSLPE